MVISTGNHPKALWPGVHAFVMGKYDKHPTEYTKVFEVESSKMAYEEDVETTGFGLVPTKAEGSATSYDSHTQGFTKRYTHVARSMGYIVTREERDDNLYKKKSFQRGEMLAFSFRTTKEIVAANVLNRAFNSSYTGGDAKELLATDHPTLAGTFSNELAVAADLSEASLEDMLTQIMQATNSRGLQIAIRGDCLIVPPALAFDAERILKSALQSGTGNNDVNAVKSMGLLPQGSAVNHYLTDTDAWFIKTNAPNGMMCFERTGFEFTQDNDFDTSNAKAKGYERYAFGWTDPRGMFGSAGAAKDTGAGCNGPPFPTLVKGTETMTTTTFPNGIKGPIYDSSGAAITDLTDNSGGTPSDTIAAIGATYDQAEVRNAIASLAAKITEVTGN